MRRVILGKSARVLAEEMAEDVANPLHLEGQSMVKCMDDLEAARQRVISLQGRLVGGCAPL